MTMQPLLVGGDPAVINRLNLHGCMQLPPLVTFFWRHALRHAAAGLPELKKEPALLSLDGFPNNCGPIVLSKRWDAKFYGTKFE